MKFSFDLVHIIFHQNWHLHHALWASFGFVSSITTASHESLIHLAVSIHTTMQSIKSINGDPQPHHYIALYKPALTLCTFVPDDEHRIQKKGRRDTLADIDDKLNQIQGLHCVGRLDFETEGLLLLTTDGKFTAEVHARCAKKYWVVVEGKPTDSAIEKMKAGGLEIRGAVTRPPVSLRVLSSNDDNEVLSKLPDSIPRMDRPGTWFEIILDEGRNRQIRRIMKHAGHKVIRLCRISVGCIEYGDAIMPTKAGEWRSFEKNLVFDAGE